MCLFADVPLVVERGGERPRLPAHQVTPNLLLLGWRCTFVRGSPVQRAGELQVPGMSQRVRMHPCEQRIASSKHSEHLREPRNAERLSFVRPLSVHDEQVSVAVRPLRLSPGSPHVPVDPLDQLSEQRHSPCQRLRPRLELINGNYSCRLPRRRSDGRGGGREACETARFPRGGRVGHGCAGSAIARETDVGEDVGGDRGGGGNERTDGATVAERRVAVDGEGASDVADAGGPVRRGVGVGGGAAAGGRHRRPAAGVGTVQGAVPASSGSLSA